MDEKKNHPYEWSGEVFLASKEEVLPELAEEDLPKSSGEAADEEKGYTTEVGIEYLWEKLETLQHLYKGAYEFCEDTMTDIGALNGFFWTLVHKVSEADDLKSLVKETERIAKEYNGETGFIFDPNWEERFKKERVEKKLKRAYYLHEKKLWKQKNPD